MLHSSAACHRRRRSSKICEQRENHNSLLAHEHVVEPQMSEERKVVAGFEVAVEKLHALGVVDPYCRHSLELYASGKLTSEERLYFVLLSSATLNSAPFTANKSIVTKGQPVGAAYFVVRGQLLGVDGDKLYRLGPGSVIGLAEGLAGLPYSMSAVTVSTVETRVIPVHQIASMLGKMPAALRGIVRTVVMRTLGLDFMPSTLR
jgi:CRP-like cAMP-binding protein